MDSPPRPFPKDEKYKTQTLKTIIFLKMSPKENTSYKVGAQMTSNQKYSKAHRIS